MIKNLFRKTILLTTSFMLTVGLVPNTNISSNQKLNITTNNIEINNQDKQTNINKENIITTAGGNELYVAPLKPVQKKNNYKYTGNNERYIVTFEDETFLEIEYKNIRILLNKKENTFNVYLKNKNFSKEFYTLSSLEEFIQEYLKSGEILDYTIYVDDLKTNEDLEKYAKLFLKNEFNLELNIPIYFTDIEDPNTLGLFRYYEDESKAVEILIDNEEVECDHQYEKILVHELCHYVLFELGGNFKDGENEFENLLYEKGGRSNYNNEFKPLDTKLSVDCCS
ncbi:MAG: hypothetical protein E7H33_09425 [Clostridium perfringens]|uniref:hypothetical protein n=1 Tax=Clostridium perfringens TaxID=1502 RepID=UPI00290C2549|nr:hypothetical protein [Clostridium perfringens]MDU4051123.1 hypothetical protein [Clostridium perfringens]